MLLEKRLNLLLFFNSILFIVLFFSTSFIIISTSSKINNIATELNFNQDNAYIYLQDQLNINNTHYRVPGTIGREECAQYFISKFQNISSSISIMIQNFTIHSTKCQNLLFKINENKSNIVILGAHYDSRAKATKDPDLTKRSDPIPGANDGASGSAVLLELASVLFQQRDDLNCQLWFVFFDAEDQGEDSGGYGIEGWDWCEGSKRFTKDINMFYDSEKESFDCMILLDMVGGINLQFIAEQYSSSSLVDELFDIGRGLGYTYEYPSIRTSSSVLDDHYYFAELGIPTADLIINFWNDPKWPYHHTLNDDITFISTHSLGVTGSTIEQFVYNNFLSNVNNNYQGNYPWRFDLNSLDSLDSEILVIISVFCIIIVVALLFNYSYQLDTFKKTSLSLKE